MMRLAMAMVPCVSAPLKELDERLDIFHLSASTLGGTTVEISDINATTSVGELLDNVESVLCISRGCSTCVTAAGELLSRDHACISLAESGIVSGSTLNVTVRGARLYTGRRRIKCKHMHLNIALEHYSEIQQPFHLLLSGDGVCRLAFLRTIALDHAGGPDHYTTDLHCKNILVGTHVLDGDMAVCTWTTHLEFIPPCLDAFCVHIPAELSTWDLQAQLVGPKEANASAEYQRIDFSECVMCDAIDPILSESDLPTSMLGLGLFETDEIGSLESRWRSCR